MTPASGRIGILGGTFDPVHEGHVAAADAALRALALDRVLFIPSHQPPHRPGEPCASAFHRFAMVSLVAASRDEFVASDLELRRPGPSFTADTLRELHASGVGPQQIFFITGTDAFAEIANWRDGPCPARPREFRRHREAGPVVRPAAPSAADARAEDADGR